VAQAGFGKSQKKAKAPAKPVARPTAAAPGVAPLGFTATPDQLTSGNWNDVLPDVVKFFEQAGKVLSATNRTQLAVGGYQVYTTSLRSQLPHMIISPASYRM
jgi:hypothetical protein